MASVEEMVSYFNTLKPGQDVTLSVFRENETVELQITLAEWLAKVVLTSSATSLLPACARRRAGRSPHRCRSSSEMDNGPDTTDASFWRIPFSLAGPRHVLYLKAELTGGGWRIYSDNIAMARWLQVAPSPMTA